MLKITWIENSVPSSLKVTQVYGIIFDIYGRILLKIEDKKDKKEYSFIGGKPETFDKDITSTLKRELKEEVNVEIEEPIYIGYQLIEGDRDYPYAQIRMTSLIKHIGKSQIDPDNGKTYIRVLVDKEKAKALLNYGKVGDDQIEKAYKEASSLFKFKDNKKEIEYI